MKIVIDIDNEYFEIVRHQVEHGNDFLPFKIIALGTPLPKGHGRLIDSDYVWNELKELEEQYQEEFLKSGNLAHDCNMAGRLFAFTTSKFIVQDAPTIIEAEREDTKNGKEKY